MNRVTKLNLTIFIILTIFSIIMILFGVDGGLDLNLIFITLLFNVSLGILVILMMNRAVKMSKRGYRVFILYLVISFILYWYALSFFLQFYYGSFLRLGGLYYFIATRTLTSLIAFYFCSALVTLSMAFLFYFISRKYIFESSAPEKIMNKKIKALIILSPLFILILIILVIPENAAARSTPLIDNIVNVLRVDDPNFNIDKNYTEVKKEKILDLNLNLENPNFVVILLESISQNHFPIYGYERDITPNINNLAKKSIVFENAYSIGSHSDYAQTGFLSSRYMIINDHRNFFNKNYPRTFMWDILKSQNYSTAYISSQDDEWANMINYYNLETLDYYSHSLTDGSYDYGSGNAKKDYDEKTTTKVISWLNKTINETKPFYLYINYQATHYPYSYPENNSIFTPDKPSKDTSYFEIPKKDYNKSLNDYDNSIFYVDKQIGNIINYLENNNLSDNTVIIITSDHGETLIRNHGFIRHGFGVYEEEVKVPLIIYLPKTSPQRIKERVRNLDVVPTILNLTNFENSEHFQGEPMLTNQNIYLTAQNQNFKLGVIKDNIKYTTDGFSNIAEVYNLTSDPDEKENLIKNNNDKIFYYIKYGHFVYDWFNCQKKYYKEELWENGEVIDCG